MADIERAAVYRILNAITTYTSTIDQKLECVILPREREEMMCRIGEALKSMNFFDDENDLNSEGIKHV